MMLSEQFIINLKKLWTWVLILVLLDDALWEESQTQQWHKTLKS